MYASNVDVRPLSSCSTERRRTHENRDGRVEASPASATVVVSGGSRRARAARFGPRWSSRRMSSGASYRPPAAAPAAAAAKSASPAG